MFKLLLITIALSILTVQAQDSTNAPQKITAFEAKKHIGDNAIVTGTVAEVSLAERLVRLNLDRRFPEQPFTAVIFSNKTNLFPELQKLKGKAVEISGKISAYHDRPQIVLTATNQLKVIEKPVASEGAKKE